MKEIISYVHGSFVDYRGDEHHVTVCGLSVKTNKFIDIEKFLRIGVSICNPSDDYDVNVGESMALSRARGKNAIIMTTNKSGMFNTATVNCILNDYLKYILDDPGAIIKGYDEGKVRYFENVELMNRLNTLTDNEIECVKALASATPESIKLAKRMVKLLQN